MKNLNELKKFLNVLNVLNFSNKNVLGRFHGIFFQYFFFFKFLFSKLIDRLDNIKKHATGNGSSQCVLCADGFGMLGASSILCIDCQKVKINKMK